MKPRLTRRRPASSPPRWTVALTLCCLGLAACSGPERPLDAARIAPVEREVTLRIEPQAGRIEALQARAVLTRIASDLALDFEVADLTQAGDQTSFRLVVRNRGSALSELKVRLSGDRARPSGADTLQLGALAENGETSAELRFDNPSGQGFIVTLNLWAMLAANGAAAPSSDATPGAANEPSPAPSAHEAPASSAPSSPPSAAPSAGPEPGPNGLPTAAPTPLAPPLANPGPNAARGRILLNGQGAEGIKLSLIRNPGWAQQTVVTGADGSFTAKDLEPGDYLLYYYNDSDRNKIGYWRSRSQRLDATTGAAFPVIDFYQLGLKNLPAMDAHRTLPVTFEWVPQTQTVDYYRFRLHSTGGRSFTLIHQSDKLPGNSNRFTWDGAGTTLDPKNRYFWGVFWDAGALGEGGNLYQAIYLSR